MAFVSSSFGVIPHDASNDVLSKTDVWPCGILAILSPSGKTKRRHFFEQTAYDPPLEGVVRPAWPLQGP